MKRYDQPASCRCFWQQWFCSCRAWMICYKHLRIVSRLTTPKTLNCFILASTIGFGFHRTCKSRKNHFPKLHFWGSYINISKVAVPRLDRAMSDPCLNWDHVTPTEQQTWKHFHRSRRRFQSRFTSGHAPRAPRKNTNRWVTLIVFKVEAMSGRLRCENGNMFS